MAVSDIVLPITFKSDTRGLKKAEDELKKFGRNVGKIAAGATAAVAGIAAVSVKAFADFDAALQQSVSIMGDVSDAMREDMSEAAREVAKTTTFSAEQAAESFFFLASAGLDAEQSIAALPQVASFAQAGMFDMALATDLLTDAQSALGLTSDETATNMENMARVSDVLVGANTLANASVQQFSEALTNRAGAALKATGKDIEEGVAVLAAFADQGIKGVEAGTRFDMVLRDLQTRAIKNKDAFEQFNIQVFDSEGEMRNLGDIIGEVEDALGGLSDEQARAALQTLGFTDRSVASLLALLGTSDAIKEYQSSLESMGGVTGEVADKQLNTFSAQLGLLKSAFGDVGIEIGSILVPHLSRLVNSMGPLIAQATPALVSLFLSLVPVIEQLVAGFPAFVNALMPLIPIMGEIAGLIGEMAIALLPIFMQVLNMLLPVFQTLATALRDNAGLITTIVASIAGFLIVGNGISKLITIFSAFKVVIGAVSSFVTGFGTVFTFLGGLIPKIGGAFKLLMPVLTLVKGAFMKLGLVLLANPIGLVIAGVVALTAALTWFFTQTELGKQIWAGFVLFFQQLLLGMQIAFQMLVQQLVELWAGFDEKVRAFSQAIADFFAMIFGETIPAIWQGMIDFFVTGYEGFIEGFKTAWESVKEFFRNLVNGFVSLFEGFINLAIDGLNALIDKANEFQITIPDWVPKIGGKSFGINLPNVPRISLPRLAEGGIVDRTTIAMIGEAGPEAVVPLDRLGEMGGGPTYNITIQTGVGDPVRIGEEVVTAIKRYERVSGPVFASA